MRAVALLVVVLASAPGLVAGPGHSPSVSPPQVFPWEDLGQDYERLRGLNFIPTYRSLAGSAGFYGVASPTAQWWFYDMNMDGTAGEVNAQLGYLKSMGCNAVRVWLSYPAYLGMQGQTPDLIDKFRFVLGEVFEQAAFGCPVAHV